MVRVHILAQKRDLLEAVAQQLLHLGEDGPGTAAALAPPGIGHHTIGAEIVAAAHNGDESGDTVHIVTHRQDVLVSLLFGKHHVELRTALARLGDELRQRAIGIGAGNEVEYRLGFKQLLLHPLGHTTQQTHLQAVLFFLQSLQFLKPLVDALFGFVANRTSVNEYQIRLIYVASQGEHILKNGCNNFTISKIHLTSVCFYV